MRILVRKEELACRNSWGSDLWTSANATHFQTNEIANDPESDQILLPILKMDDEVTSVTSSEAVSTRATSTSSDLDDVMVGEASLVPEQRDVSTRPQAIFVAQQNDSEINSAAHADQDERVQNMARGNHAALKHAQARMMGRRSTPVEASLAPVDDGSAINESLPTMASPSAGRSIEQNSLRRTYDDLTPPVPASETRSNAIQLNDDVFDTVPDLDPSIDLPLMDEETRAFFAHEQGVDEIGSELPPFDQLTTYDHVLQRARAIRAATEREKGVADAGTQRKGKQTRNGRRINIKKPTDARTAVHIDLVKTPSLASGVRQERGAAITDRSLAEDAMFVQPVVQMPRATSDASVPAKRRDGALTQPAASSQLDLNTILARGVSFHRRDESPHDADTVSSEIKESVESITPEPEHAGFAELENLPVIWQDETGTWDGDEEYGSVEVPLSASRRRSFGIFGRRARRTEDSTHAEDVRGTDARGKWTPEIEEPRPAPVGRLDHHDAIEDGNVEDDRAWNEYPIKPSSVHSGVAGDNIDSSLQEFDAIVSPMESFSQEAPFAQSWPESSPRMPEKPSVASRTDSLYRPIRQSDPLVQRGDEHGATKAGDLARQTRWIGRDVRVRASSMESVEQMPLADAPFAEKTSGVGELEPVIDLYQPLPELIIEPIQAPYAGTWSFAQQHVDVSSADGLESFRSRVFGQAASSVSAVATRVDRSPETRSRGNEDVVEQVPVRAEDLPTATPKGSPLRSASFSQRDSRQQGAEPARDRVIGTRMSSEGVATAPAVGTTSFSREDALPDTTPDSEISRFDIRDVILGEGELQNMAPTIAPDVPRACRTCRDFRPSESGERGFCANSWAFTHSQMVNADDLPCQSTIGCWWLPSDEVWLPEVRAQSPTPRVGQLVTPVNRGRRSG